MNDTSNEHERLVEQSLHGWLAEDRPLPADREIQIDTVLQQTREATGTRRRFLGWLERGDEARRRRRDHDIPYDTYPGRNRLMYTATSLVAVLAIVALSVNVITDTGQPPAVGGGATLSVAADGSGDHASIGKAVEAAADGDTILVGPGVYQEALLIDKDVTITGDGPREDIVITAYADPEMWPVGAGRACKSESVHPGCAVLIVEASPTLSNLTFSGDFAGVFAFGGAPVLEQVTFIDVGRILLSSGARSGHPLVLLDGSRLTLRDSELIRSRGIWIDGDSEPTIESNELTGGSDLAVVLAGDGTVVRGNHFSGAPASAIAVFGPTRMLIEDNVIRGADEYAIHVSYSGGLAEGVDPVIRGNLFEANGRGGVVIEAGAAPAIEGNRFIGNPTGVQVGDSTATIAGNEIREGRTGIVVVSRGAPTITDNVIDVTGRGIVAGANTSPTVSGNDVCGGEMSIYLSVDATPDLGENQTCEGAAA